MSYIGFGANLGEPQKTLAWVIKEMNGRFAKLCRVSPLYRTTPWGNASGPDYINAVIELETMLTAPELLRYLQDLERACGRERRYPNAPRICDLDILLYGDLVISNEEIEIPHPRLHLRRFVLAPLCDLIPEKEHPVLDISFEELLDMLRDDGLVFPVNSVFNSALTL